MYTILFLIVKHLRDLDESFSRRFLKTDDPN